MDGVLWRGNETLPGVPDFLIFLHDHAIPYVLATNNSSRNPLEYVTRSEALGIPIDIEHIVTSGVVTAEVLTNDYPPGTSIYVIGSASLVQLLASHGFIVHSGSVIDRVQVVVVGLDVTLTYEKLNIAGRHILAGAEFIGTNGDKSLPVQGGIAPGSGSILAALQAMTGRAPRLMGKPEPAMFHTSLHRLGSTAGRTLMIGDRLDTDIEGALRAGLKAALVLSGVSGVEETGETVPDGTYDDLAALYKAWKQAMS